MRFGDRFVRDHHVTPSTGLNRAGDQVTVSGSGFTAEEFWPVEIYQCRTQENWGDCASIGFVESGSFSGKVVPVSYSSSEIPSCEDAYCRILVFDGFGNSAHQAIAFAGSTSTTSTPSPGTPFGEALVGEPVTDTAVVTGDAVGGSPTGTMSFWICGPDGYVVCVEGGTSLGSVPVTPGPNSTASATSASFTPTTPGRYCFRSLYSGSAVYGASLDARQRECFTAKFRPTVTSSVSPSWVRPGDNFTGVAVLGGTAAGGSPTGGVSFYLCKSIPAPATCDEGGTFMGSSLLGAGPNNTASASSYPPDNVQQPGRNCFRVEYGGDARYFSVKDSSASACIIVGYYPRPTGATPVRVPLVPASEPCTSPNRTHGAPLSFPSCSPPDPVSSTAFIGIGDGNPAPAKSIGWVLLKALPGVAGGPDDSDVEIGATITNVMKTSDRSEYLGELQAVLRIRLTDRALNENTHPPQTTTDFPFRVTIPCESTVDTTIAAKCSVVTTADSVLPGTVPEGMRSIWQLDEVELHDGGPDGDAETLGDNALFATQGVFTP